jgi:molybdate-binding protein
MKLYPAEETGSGVVPHDGVYRGGSLHGEVEVDPEDTLIMACCDPAVGLLAAELARAADVRLIAFPRSSRTAMSLIGQGLVHVAGVHLARAEQAGGNAAIVMRELGAGYNLLRVARWEEGIAFAPGVRVPSVREAVDSNLRWVGREDGSGARQCLDELFGDHRPPRRLASDHRGVAEAVRSGWADAGVCLRLVSEEAGLDFLSVRQENYDLCFPECWEGDHRIQALIQVVRSPSYRKALGELPGYDSAQTGELHRVS